MTVVLFGDPISAPDSGSSNTAKYVVVEGAGATTMVVGGCWYNHGTLLDHAQSLHGEGCSLVGAGFVHDANGTDAALTCSGSSMTLRMGARKIEDTALLRSQPASLWLTRFADS